MEWKHISTYGYTLDLFGRGNERKIVDRETGQTIVEYTI